MIPEIWLPDRCPQHDAGESSLSVSLGRRTGTHTQLAEHHHLAGCGRSGVVTGVRGPQKAPRSQDSVRNMGKMPNPYPSPQQEHQLDKENQYWFG